MGALRKTFLEVKKNLDNVVNLATIVVLGLLVVVVSLQVIFRYVFNNPLAWSEELARYLSIWMVYLASAIVFREDAHMSMDFLVIRIPEKAQRIISIVTKTIISIFLLVIIIKSKLIIDITMSQTSPSLSIPMGFVYLALPVGFGLMLFELVSRVVLHSKKGEF